MSSMRINAGRLQKNLQALSQIGRTSNGAISRVAFSDAEVEGRAFVKELLVNANLVVRVDAAGNMFGRREGARGEAPAIVLGSHIDTVPDGGAFDGALGVLAAVEVAKTLEEQRFQNQNPVEVAVWSDEEGGLSGSRAFIGDLPEAELERMLPIGVRLREGIERVGGDPTKITNARCSAGRVAAYVELHVEQGGLLEAENVDIGVVSGIVGIRHFCVTITGTPNHAGTTPMGQRRNALLAASDFVLAVDRIVQSVPGTHVGTVGELNVSPGAPNVIPGEVVLTAELRDLETAKIDHLWTLLEPELERCGTQYGTTSVVRAIHTVQGTPTDPRIQEVLRVAAESLSLTCRTMPSGAGHDAQNLAQLTPTGMVFVPSVGGVSHSGQEYTRPEDVANGANVLLSSLVAMDGEM